jgi:carboxyl-terminal processing protease
MKTRHPLALIVLSTLVLFSFKAVKPATQKASKLEIEQWRDVLRNVKRELKDNYYDPTFHGIDIEARFEAADEKMKNAESLGQLVGIVAQTLLDLNDSHTFFIPPYNASSVDYGWRMKPVGVDCYVGAVRPGSDAEAKGLRPGDKVLAIDGRPLDRTRVWLANYLYDTLRPQPSMTLVIEKPDRQQQQVVIQAKVREGSAAKSYGDYLKRTLEIEEEYRLTRNRFYEPSDDVLIWKMPQFDLNEDGLADKFGKLKNRKALILDLRGNYGGYVYTLEHFAGYFVDSDIKLADRRGRKKLDPMVAKSKKDKAFKGQLIVLIDGESASAAEVFARFVQLQKLGVVIGDRSSGSVMESRYHEMQVGIVRGLAFAMSATDADVIMADGKSLEHVGVVPDKLLIPTAQDMSANHDPVLTYAASLAGIQLDPKKAGELFPMEWKSR